jgi:nucleotide-binding universal stress UspA family protein
MYHSILVPLDGSPFAEEALPLAISIANRAGASLEVMQVHEAYSLRDAFYSWSPYYPALDEILKEKGLAYLDSITTRLKKTALVPATSALMIGAVGESIIECARGKDADLIVMTTHGRSPLSRFWLGSVADELVRHAPIPILLVRTREFWQDPGPTLKQILVPLDGSVLAERVLEPTLALGTLMGAKYTFVRAVETGLRPSDRPHLGKLKAAGQSEIEKRKAEAQTYLDGVAGRLRAKALCIQTRIVVGEMAANAVLDVARQNIDLIAIATHGRGGFKRLFLGSVADKIVRGAFTPVLVYRPTASESLRKPCNRQAEACS